MLVRKGEKTEQTLVTFVLRRRPQTTYWATNSELPAASLLVRGARLFTFARISRFSRCAFFPFLLLSQRTGHRLIAQSLPTKDVVGWRALVKRRSGWGDAVAARVDGAAVVAFERRRRWRVVDFRQLNAGVSRDFAARATSSVTFFAAADGI